MPDDQLFALAEEGSLLKTEVLEREFERMLADEKSDRFADQFSTQWLDLDGVDRVAINPRYYEKFDSSLKTDMMGETRAFFREILRSESSALQFIDADFTMLNASLAKHYGLEGPKSQRFERVSLKGTADPVGYWAMHPFNFPARTGPTPTPSNGPYGSGNASFTIRPNPLRPTFRASNKAWRISKSFPCATNWRFTAKKRPAPIATAASTPGVSLLSPTMPLVCSVKRPSA